MRVLFFLFLFSVVLSDADAFDRQPEDTVTVRQKGPFFGSREMVVAAHPIAVEVGSDILKSGGSAVDAMVAVQMVLNLVEPQSSGIGGGAFLLYHDATANQLVTLDGRETAPKAATPALFLNDSNTPRPWPEVVPGGLSVGTPGTLALMKRAHERYGRLAWSQVLEPAIDLAEAGFYVSPRLSGSLSSYGGKRLHQFNEARNYFFPKGEPLSVGYLLKNLEFAATLRELSRSGLAAFYDGEIGRDIVAAVRGSTINPGRLSVDDLASYQVIDREPVCIPYREHRVCGMGLPSSGGITVAQMLGILEPFNLPMLGPDHPLTWHLFSEAGKLAYADRNQYLADGDFVDVPVDGLIDRDYLASRSRLIDLNRAMPTPVSAGQPTGFVQRYPDHRDGLPGTSHVSIIDQFGNAVSLTTTIESGFGSGLFVRGFLLNNELTDFSFIPEKNGLPVANRVEAMKRPRSSMAPTMIYGPDGSLRFILGSPGGSRIINYVAQTIIGLLDFNMSPQEAINLGRMSSRNGAIDLEKETEIALMADKLGRLGHEVKLRDLNSGLHVIEVKKDRLIGGADPRREGIGMGR